MKLPEGVLRHHFDAALHRGAVIRFEADDLDDPTVRSKVKYAVILSVDCSESSTLYAFTTSQLAFFDKHPHLATDILKVQPGSYSWCTVETAINLRDVRPIARDQLLNKTLDGKLTFEGDLSRTDIEKVDEILRKSKLLPARVLAKILPKSVERPTHGEEGPS